MLRSVLPRAILAAVLTTVSAAYANAQQFQATLSGFDEDPLLLVSTGVGTLRVTLNRQQQSLTYTLEYSDLLAPVLQAHIHLGRSSQSGGISVFLCTNLGNGPAGTPACPASGPVSGMLTPASVIGPSAQGIEAGEFDKLAEALLANATYGNVHSQRFPGGEIRGALRLPQDK